MFCFKILFLNDIIIVHSNGIDFDDSIHTFFTIIKSRCLAYLLFLYSENKILFLSAITLSLQLQYCVIVCQSLYYISKIYSQLKIFISATLSSLQITTNLFSTIRKTYLDSIPGRDHRILFL